MKVFTRKVGFSACFRAKAQPIIRPAMDSARWLEFTSSKIRSQISYENARKAENWAVALLSGLSLAGAFGAVGAQESSSPVLFGSKVLFLIFFHAFMTLGVFLPAVLQKGQKPFSKLAGIRDYTSLLVIGLIITFYFGITAAVSWQAAFGLPKYSEYSGIFKFVLGLNVVPALFYLGAAIMGFWGLAAFPAGYQKFLEGMAKGAKALLAAHAGFLFLLFIAYTELSAVGSPTFFQHLHIAGLFWVSMACALFLAGRLLQPSFVNTLSGLELEIASGRFERAELILFRYKEIFVSKRLDLWLHRASRVLSERAHEIASNSHDAVKAVSGEKPSEIDLRLVEERFRKAESQAKKLELEYNRFTLNHSLWVLNEVEQIKTDELRDQFSKESRNAKLEIASVRKRIDERLIALRPLLQPAIPTTAAPALQAPKQEVVSQETTTSTTR